MGCCGYSEEVEEGLLVVRWGWWWGFGLWEGDERFMVVGCDTMACMCESAGLDLARGDWYLGCAGHWSHLRACMSGVPSLYTPYESCLDFTLSFHDRLYIA